MINKRFQVFVSSTYTDLIDERAEIMQALLELDCMPAGMELFPAANEEQWHWIKKVIDESDYYLVVIAGRYGTISETGMSYTEMEYRYAIDTHKPVISFLHEDPSKIETGKTENSIQGRKKLDQFRKLTEQRLCKYWSSSTDLGAKVSRGITQLIKHHPSPGWIRSDQAPVDHSQELLEMKRIIQELEDKLREVGLQEPIGVDHLSKGQDKFIIDFCFSTSLPKTSKNGSRYFVKGENYDHSIESTWDSLFKYLAPDLIVPISDWRLVSNVNNYLKSLAHDYFIENFPETKIENVEVYSDSIDVIKIQLRSLKLIEIETDGQSWKLTPYGDNYMTKLLAIRKE